MKTLYFDFAASTPVDPAVLKAMRPYFTEVFGNPGAVHIFGQQALAAEDRSRQTIAQILKLDPLKDTRQIIFTSGATEANNLALRGTILAWQKKYAGNNVIPRLIVSAVEHDSVLKTAENLAEENNVELIVIPVNRQGFIDLKKLRNALDERTVLVSVIYAQNEIGSIQPVGEIAKIIREFRQTKLIGRSTDQADPVFDPYPLFHTDAVQAFQYLECSPDFLGVDLMTISGHKIYGPKGVGLLYIKENKAGKSSLVAPIITGGGQEFGLRSGTENVPAIVGLAKAMELASIKRTRESRRIYRLRSIFWRQLKKHLPKSRLNGPLEAEVISKDSRFLPSILNICFSGFSAEELIVKFDLAGISVSAGSACASRALEPSHVLRQIGLSEKASRSSLRFSFGGSLTEADIREAVRRIVKTLKP